MKTILTCLCYLMLFMAFSGIAMFIIIFDYFLFQANFWGGLTLLGGEMFILGSLGFMFLSDYIEDWRYNDKKN